MLRLIVLVKYFMVVQDIRIIVYTIRRLAQPFMSILFAFYLITYEYIVVGMVLFGTHNRMKLSWAQENLGDLTYVLNFNDFISSFTVMSTLVIGNNWNDFVDCWIQISGKDFWTKVYFSSYLFAAEMIIMNIIVSFVLEVFDGLSEEVSTAVDKEKNLMYLAKALPNGQGLEELIKENKRRAKSEQTAQIKNLVSQIDHYCLTFAFLHYRYHLLNPVQPLKSLSL